MQQSSTTRSRPPVAGQPRRAAPTHRGPLTRSSNSVRQGVGDGGGGGGGGGGGDDGPGGGGGGGGGGGSGSRGGALGTTKSAVSRTPNSDENSARCESRLTEGNVARLLVGGRGATTVAPSGKSGALGGRWMTGGSSASRGGGGWYRVHGVGGGSGGGGQGAALPGGEAGGACCEGCAFERRRPKPLAGIVNARRNGKLSVFSSAINIADA